MTLRKNPHWIGTAMLCLAMAPTLLSEEISYNYQVRPILSDKCFGCHGPDAANNKSELRLDKEEFAYAKLKESNATAIIPGNLEESELWKRLITKNSEEVMPPQDSHLLPLTDEEKSVIKQWIQQGAKYEPHWSFVSLPAKIEVPKVAGLTSTNPIDSFIAQRLNRKGWKLSERASKITLLRRVSYDLTGLPPSDAITKAFLEDNSPQAYEKLVDQLLASPQYGEHLASYWLEASRYADTSGYQHDWKWQMYPWRTWVIQSFNKNVPFNEFVTWQLAGDLLPNPTQEQLLASGFNRLHRLNTEGGALPEEYQVENVVDRVETVTTSLLGLTMACARCHDHKYDPLSQKDFYSFYAFFNNTSEAPTPAEFTNGLQSAGPFIEVQEQSLGEGPEKALVFIANELKERRPTYLLNRGAYDQPNKEMGLIEPATPKGLLSFDGFAKNRLGLAQWITAKENPLFSRVIVNRFWQQCFGKGIVVSSEDFGLQGALPTHPELLDWLSLYWMDNGWDTKKLLRLIVTSDTYCQAAMRKPDTLVEDPKNTLLSYFPRKRLTAYAIRDQALAVSGLLKHHIGGRSVNPYQPEGMWEEISSPDAGVARSPFGTTVYKQDHGDNLYRRSVYTFWKRSSPPPTLGTFDAPSREVCSVRHDITNTPLQALALLNGTTYLEAARNMAAKAIQSYPEPTRMEQLMTSVLKRSPSENEKNIMARALTRHLDHYRSNPDQAKQFLAYGESPNPAGLDPIQQAAWTQISLLILNLDETITKP